MDLGFLSFCWPLINAKARRTALAAAEAAADEKRSGRIDGLRKVLNLPEERSSGEVLDAARVWIEANVRKEPTEREPREPSGQCDVCSAPLCNVCAPLPDGGKACSARCVDLHRLARAAGVPPGSEDPVGAVEAAIRAGRKPEVVTGAEAMELPRGSRVVRVDENDIPEHCAEVREITPGRTSERQRAQRYLVLHRAPAPAPAPLTVGEVVEDAADLDRRATVGTIVTDQTRVVGQLTQQHGWLWVDGGHGLGAGDERFHVTVVWVGAGGEV